MRSHATASLQCIDAPCHYVPLNRELRERPDTRRGVRALPRGLAADQRLQREASSIEIALEKVARPSRLFLTCSYHQRRGSHPVSTRSVLTFKTCTHAPQTLQGPHKASGKQARHGRNTCICSRFCGNSAHCNGGAASEEARGRGCSRGLWIAIHKHMIEQGRHGRPRASLDRPWPQRDERTQTPCRHRRSAVHSANRRHQLRASSCHDLISKRARLDRRRPLACFESMPGRYSARPGGAGRGPGQEARAGRAGSMVAEQVRWSPAYPFSAAPSAAQSIVASFEVDAPADLPHGTRGAVSPADCRPIGAGWASIRAEGAYRAGLNCRRHTRPAARPPRLDRLSRSAPFPSETALSPCDVCTSQDLRLLLPVHAPALLNRRAALRAAAAASLPSS